jgi:hypothetical protein
MPAWPAPSGCTTSSARPRRRDWTARGLLARLGDVAGCRVDVVELPRGTSAFGPHLDEAVRARLLGEV